MTCGWKWRDEGLHSGESYHSELLILITINIIGPAGYTPRFSSRKCTDIRMPLDVDGWRVIGWMAVLRMWADIMEMILASLKSR